MQIGQILSGNATEDNFGHSVEISADGMTIICGSPGDFGYDDPPGYVRVFSIEGNDIHGTETFWKQIGQDIIGEANGDQFGWFVSISKDGKTIAVGAKTNDGNTGKEFGGSRQNLPSGGRWYKLGTEWRGHRW